MKTPHPFQRKLADVALELLPNGQLAYDTVVLKLPRRSGKTVLGLGAIMHRGHAFAEFGRQLSMSVSQSGVDSRSMYLNSWRPMIEASEFAGTVEFRNQISHELLMFENGSVHSIRAPKVGAGVGGDLDFLLVDEAWSLEDASFEEAVWPASATRAMAQRWILSMEGDLTSQYLIDKCELGRASVDMGRTEGICYLEYSADPETQDLTDEATWWATHPALGRTVTIERLRSFANEMSPEAFAKEFLNVMPRGKAVVVFNPLDWEACIDESSGGLRGVQLTGPLHYAFDAPESQTEASIVVAAERADGLMHIEIVAQDNGVEWLKQVIPRIHSNAPGSWHCDARSGARTVNDDLAKVGITVNAGTTIDACDGAAGLFAAVKAHTIRHLGPRQPALDTAFRSAVKRRIGDRFAWGRVPGIDGTPLQAATLALLKASKPVAATGPLNNWRPWDVGRQR